LRNREQLGAISSNCADVPDVRHRRGQSWGLFLPGARNAPTGGSGVASDARIWPSPAESVRRANGSDSMNVFTTIVPNAPQGAGPTFVVAVFQDAETHCWIGTSDDIPLATEAPTLDQLIERVWLIAPEVADLNGIPARDMRLRFVMDTQPAPH
jgi:Domain of unknown function (DUF1902)